jgi:hypothetical protein
MVKYCLYKTQFRLNSGPVRFVGTTGLDLGVFEDVAEGKEIIWMVIGVLERSWGGVLLAFWEWGHLIRGFPCTESHDWRRTRRRSGRYAVVFWWLERHK